MASFKHLFLLLFLGLSFCVCKARPPEKASVSVLPSAKWCVENGYFEKKKGENGRATKEIKYEAAIKKSKAFRKASKLIRKGLKKKGFAPLTTEKSLAYEKSKKKKADFQVKVDWQKKGQQMMLSMKALHGNSSVGNVLETSKMGKGASKLEQLEKILPEHVDELGGQMERYLKDLKKNGEKVSLLVRVGRTGSHGFNEPCIKNEKVRIKDALQETVEEAALKGKYREGITSSIRMVFEAVRIPYDSEKSKKLAK